MGVLNTVCIAAIVIAWPALVAAQPFAYVANSNSSTISVFNLASNSVAATIPSVGTPSSVAASARSGRVYVRGNSTLQVIDALKNAPISATFLTYPGSHGLALSPSADRLYIAKSNVAALDPSELCVVRTRDNIELGCALSPATEPFGIAVSPDGSRIYVTQQNTLLGVAGTVSIFQADPLQYLGSVAVGTTPTDIVLHPNGQRAYVANADSANISVVDLAGLSVVATITVGQGPRSLALSANGQILYVANALSDTITVINTATNIATTTIVGVNNPTGLWTNAAGTTLYATSGATNSVKIIDTATRSVTSSVAVGNAPTAGGQIIGGGRLLDIDGDGEVRATTDLLIMMRWQLGIRGANLLTGLTIDPLAARTTSADIEAYLAALDGLNAAR
jgi:YVTN family beta-propeller protein